MSPTEHQKFTRFTPYIAMILIALVGGTFFTIMNNQHNQEVRSRASGTITVTANPLLDTYVSMTSPTTDHSSNLNFRIKGGSTEASIALLVFDLSSLPPGSTISTATLKLHTDSESDAPSKDVYPITIIGSGSLPSSVNWNTKPTMVGTIAGSIAASSPSTWYSYNITPSVLQANAGKVVVLAMGGTSSTDGIWYDSSETSNKPQLQVTYTTSSTTYGYPTPTPTTAYAYPTPTPTRSYYPTPTPTRVPTPTPTVYYAPTPTRVPTPTPTTFYAPTPTPTVAYGPTPTPYLYVTPTPTPALYPTSTPMIYPTAVPGSTTIGLQLALHGLGNGGDSVNPNGKGNTTPLHPQREVTVDIYDATNTLVSTQTQPVSFDPTSGLFNGMITLAHEISTGPYTVKVKLDQFLRAAVPGIATIVSGQNTDLPKTSLISGDINNDNQVNILDYNLLMGCYSDLSPAANCAAGDEVRADLTDDGAVNQFDYNLFLRELTNRGGQ